MVKFGKKTPIFKQPFLHVLAYSDQSSRKILLTGRIIIADRYLDRFGPLLDRFQPVLRLLKAVLDYFSRV